MFPLCHGNIYNQGVLVVPLSYGNICNQGVIVAPVILW